MLELQDISFRTKDGPRAQILNQVSHRFRPDTLTVITGPNGSGKSTLAEIIMGIKAPTHGQIILEGTDITKTDITDRARQGLAFAFQNPVRFKGLTVYDLLNIASGELISPAAAGKFLAMVGLEPSQYLAREVDGKLSGGEQKRIELATVLARDAKLIIFDEPEAGIDIWSFTKLTGIFRRLKQAGKTLIIISHQEKILKIADEIIVLEAGQIKAKGAPNKIKGLKL